jgi:signal peptidase II
MIPYAILAAALVVLDQLVKFLVRANIPLGGSVPLIPGVIQLTYYQNTGAAFSLFTQHTWVLALISAAVSVAIVGAMVRRVFTRPFGLITLAVVLAGAVGNLIDRVFFRFVTDMFQTLFINFAIFNVADICVVLGGIALCVYVLFFYDKYEKKRGEGHDASSADR